MKYDKEKGQLESTRAELLVLLNKHVVPEYDKVVDKFKELMPNANTGLAVIALILARHISPKKEELIESLLMYAVEYAAYCEFKPTESPAE